MKRISVGGGVNHPNQESLKKKYSFPYHRLCTYIKSFDGKKVKISAIFSFSPFNSINLCVHMFLLIESLHRSKLKKCRRNKFHFRTIDFNGFFSCQIKKVINFYTSKCYNTQERVIWLLTAYYVFKFQIARCVKESVYLSNKFLWCFA